MIETAAEIGNGEDMTIDDLPAPSLEYHKSASKRNGQRALLAGIAAKAYADHGSQGEPLETVLLDLLCDLHHLCDATGLDFESLRERGFRHYQAEIGGQG